MQSHSIILIYFLYGLAFFSMGLLVAIEGGRAPDRRLRKALRPLAGFGLVHGAHEWLEMFENIQKLTGNVTLVVPVAARLGILAVSFISLAAFGSLLLAYKHKIQKISWLAPIGMLMLWGGGLLILRASYPAEMFWGAADAWTRYTLAIPASLLAAAGLVIQQREFRLSGLVRFGQDSLWAAVAFGWYGLVGQIFVKATALFPSNIINAQGFEAFFGFPIQLFRAAMAVMAAVFVIRFLRAFQVETDRKIAKLQAERLQTAEQREALRGELFKRVVAAQEAERQRIARDLHDETGQSLTAIGMGLRGLSTALAQAKLDPVQITNLHRLEGMTADALQELQRLIADLRPSQIDDLGLLAAVRWLGGQIQERTGLKVSVELQGKDQPASPSVKIAMFRIVQEALNNIVKHADAKNVHILLAFDGSQMRAVVQDDGRGFDQDQAQRQSLTRRPSLGLAGMQERASLLGGTVTVRSKPGQGTQIEALIPHRYEEMETSDHDPSSVGG